MYKIAGQHSFNYPPSFLSRHLERLLRSLVYLPSPSGFNRCTLKKCSHICLLANLKGEPTATCRCPRGMVMESDQQTCTGTHQPHTGKLFVNVLFTHHFYSIETVKDSAISFDWSSRIYLINLSIQGKEIQLISEISERYIVLYCFTMKVDRVYSVIYF